MGHALSPALATVALTEATRAATEYDDAVRWFADRMQAHRQPLAVEVWVVDPTLTMVLLVEHRWRGWVPPGGKVEPGEAPRAAAMREVFEETGLSIDVAPRPAAAMVRSYTPTGPRSLGLTYSATADPTAPLAAEPGQPVGWKPLDEPWESSFPDDIERIRSHVTWSTRRRS